MRVKNCTIVNNLRKIVLYSLCQMIRRTKNEKIIYSIMALWLVGCSFGLDNSSDQDCKSNGSISETAVKESMGDSISEFYDMEVLYANRIAEDADYSRLIKRPLDYVCPTSLLAMNEDYESIILVGGDTLLSDKILFDQCEYIGLLCEGCDDSSEEDPYLMQRKVLEKKAETASFNSKITVEIYPYRMIAESFISDYKILSTAGSETYFKKRQRVWRGPFKGMVWRWAAFDPDRNGIRSYCFSGCGYDRYGNFSCAKTSHGKYEFY